jgi:MFS family permease
MTQSNTTSSSEPHMGLFWGCFVALITTSFAFVTRAFLVNDPALWPTDFGLDKVQAQVLFGAGVWPFAISIILFSLVIDRIGYRTAMVISFACYAIYGVLALSAYGMIRGDLTGEALAAARGRAYHLLYWGSVILGLGNGTVEAFVNPVVATMFHRDKTKWLNILHAGWPGGLVLGGVITVLLGTKVAEDWRILIYVLAVPALVYFVMLVKARFPLNERVAAGTSYREMLAEFGVLGAAIAGFLVLKQLGEVLHWSNAVVFTLLAVLLGGYWFYCRSLGRWLIVLLCLLMMPLATTELGTDAAITGIMEDPLKQAGYSPLWVLIYTSAIMVVLRFFAGPIVKALTPLGLLATCAALAIVGLFLLSISSGLFAIFGAATLYGLGKTFFWPTTLGVVSEQSPRGGALTLNAIGGIGMLTAGVIGGPLIGEFQERSAKVAIEQKLPGVYQTVSTENHYMLGAYTAVDDAKVGKLQQETAKQVGEIVKTARQHALASVTLFPAIMLVSYLGLIAWFRSRGGYKPVRLIEDPHH